MTTTARDEALRRIAAEAEKPTGKLDLSGLALDSLPPELFELVDLESLYLGWDTDHLFEWRMSLVALPRCFSKLCRLQHLSLRGVLLDSYQEIELLPTLRSLVCSFTRIKDLRPLAGLTALQSLDCSRTDVKDLGPLAGLIALRTLDCSWTGVRDMGPLVGLSMLQSLDCSGTEVTELGPLACLTALQEFQCSGTAVKDLEPLADLMALQKLECPGTQVKDLGPLVDLTALHLLNCSGTQVKELEPLAGLTALRSLNCSRTGMKDLGPLARLNMLQSLHCSWTGVKELVPLAGLVMLQSFHCSGTQVKELGALVGMTALQALYCSGTQVRDLRPLAGLTALRSLDCSRTGVRDLGPLAGLTALQSLVCSQTEVRDLGPLASLSTLLSIDCSQTGVKDLGPLAGLTSLQSLDCSQTEVKELKPLAGLTALQSLDCSQTGVKDLKPLDRIIALQSLDCSQTEVKDLEPLDGLIALQSLNCSRTEVEDLVALTGLITLQTLDCSQTEVKRLGPLIKLTALRSLDCSRTGVNDLEPLVGLTALRSLNCAETEAKDIGPLAGLTALQSLNCLGTEVSDLRPLEGLMALQSLDLSGTEVKDLGPLKGLTVLQTLDLLQTTVSDLGPLEGLSTLQSLNCVGSAVKDLGPLAGLTALRSLECSRTRVEDLGPLAGLIGLQSLDCSGTRVKDPGPLAGLIGLQSLDLSGTEVKNLGSLATLPGLRNVSVDGAEIANLDFLASSLATGNVSLSAEHCLFEDIPLSQLNHPNLSSLILPRSRITGVPVEVLSRGRHDNCLPRLRAHVADLADGVVPLRTVKMIILGNGRVGKTQLCRRLRGLDYDERVSSTHGITLASTTFVDDETLNLWDFGGQDIYHGAHALFMQTRAVFVIAWHPEFEARPTHEYEGLTFTNQPLVYWLEFVRTMGAPGSPIIVVQCRCDKRQDEAVTLPVLDQNLQGLYIIRVAYSAKNDRGRGGLNDAITDAIAELRARDGLASIGRGRARVVAELERWRAEDESRSPAVREHRILTRAEFDALCDQGGGVSSPSALLHFLHQSGLIFHDPRFFGDRILLDQSWALEAIYAVFDRRRVWRHLRATHGRFTRELLAATAWRDHADDEQRLFLQLMQACGICFRVGGRGSSGQHPDDYEYIAPDLLPDDGAEQMAGRWDPRVSANLLVYKYTFMHPGLFRGLMADIGQAAENVGVYWRTGLWLHAQASHVRVRIDVQTVGDHGGAITIAMQGEDPALRKWLRERMSRQHQLYGQAALMPIVDEWGGGHAPPKPTPGPPSRQDQPAPRFSSLPPESFSRADPGRPQVFISYAWSDGGDAAVALYDALGKLDVDRYLDKADAPIGGMITDFMDRLLQGDLVFVIISERYLKSENCMYELFGVWRRAEADPGRFLNRVVPIVLPGAKISRDIDRFNHAKFWDHRHSEIDAMIKERPDLYASEDFKNYKRISDYRHHTADILFLLNDKLIPRDISRLVSTGFADVLKLVASANAGR